MISKQTLDQLVVAFAVVATALAVAAYVALRLPQVGHPISAVRPIEGADRTVPLSAPARWA